MPKLLLLLILSSNLLAKTLIINSFPVDKKVLNEIKTSGCKYQKEKWLSLLLTHESFTENITYNNSCDIQAKFKVNYNEDFKLTAQIRNRELKAFESLAHINIEFRDKPYLIIELKNAKLKSKNKETKFNLIQEFIIDPFSKDPIKESKKTKLKIIK